MVDIDYQKLSISKQCVALGVHRSGYYYRPCTESVLNLELMRLIDAKHIEEPTYGVPRMHTWLTMDEDYNINRKRIERLFTIMGIRTLGPVPNTSKPNIEAYKYPYLLKNLDIVRPNQVWATDITYVPMQKGFLYLSAIIDWHSRCILHWDISNCMDREWCVKLLQDTLGRYPKPEIFNTDQGSQYTSSLFTEALLDKEIKISMDGKGRALDNIIIERFWRTIKYEHIYLWPASNGKELYSGVEKYIHKYNHFRRHESLNKSTPYKTYKQIK